MLFLTFVILNFSSKHDMYLVNEYPNALNKVLLDSLCYDHDLIHDPLYMESCGT
ncbi:hypothetical protein HanIR_Chr16g0828841 [Helianthus annuus]|nr:hypothetical protein HanIR_Chr16g0828841 [Helianthus annuus]